MLGTHDEALGDLLDDACKVAAARRGTSGVDPDTVRTLLQAYYHHVAAEDLLGRDPEDVYGAAMSQYRLAARRRRAPPPCRSPRRPSTSTAGRPPGTPSSRSSPTTCRSSSTR